MSIRGTGYRDEALCHRRDRDSGKATEKEIFTNAMESSPFFFEMTSEIGKTQSVTGGVVTSRPAERPPFIPQSKAKQRIREPGDTNLVLLPFKRIATAASTRLAGP